MTMAEVQKRQKSLKVAKVVDEFTLVINFGSEEGIRVGERFLVFAVGDEIFDPDTKQTLGQLEIVKGTGKVIHVQAHMSTVVSDMTSPPGRTIRKPGVGFDALKAFAVLEMREIEEVLPPEPKPFSSPARGDLVKRI